MKLARLKQLRDHLNTVGSDTSSIHFGQVFNAGGKTLGLDEFPDDREFIKEFFGLNNKDFDFLFVPSRIQIKTKGEYVALLSSFIHLSE